jgi:hypothetical protein
LAADASSNATRACSVSFNVAAHHSKTVISRANLLACFISGHSAASLRARSGAKRREGDVINGQVLFPGMRPSPSRATFKPQFPTRFSATATFAEFQQSVMSQLNVVVLPINV